MNVDDEDAKKDKKSKIKKKWLKEVNSGFFLKSLFSHFYSPTAAWASSFYMNGNPGRVHEAMLQAYGENAGTGTTSCTLCHTTSAGGPGNINTSFGSDFVDSGGGKGLATNQLINVFANMEALNSDGDNLTNLEEFQQCSNPNDVVSTTSLCETINFNTGTNTNDGGGGGCGSVTLIPSYPQDLGGPQPPTLQTLALCLLPILIIFFVKKLPFSKVTLHTE